MPSKTPIPIDLLNQLPHFNDARIGASGKRIIWSESVDGRGCIFEKKAHGKPHLLSGDFNVRGGVGYGGGEFDTRGDMLVFADRSGSLVSKGIGIKQPLRVITPNWGATTSPSISPNGKWVLYVYSKDESEGLAIARVHGLTWPQQLVLGADFYMQPTWHPSGNFIAWTEWDHPDMPWDASRIKIGEVGGMQLRLFEERWVAGGKSCAANQPRFSPDGKWLCYIIRDGEWDNLVIYNLKRCKEKTVVAGDGFHLRQPDWIQGMRSFGWKADSLAIYHFRYFAGKTTFWKTDIRNGRSQQLNIEPIEWAVQMDISAEENRIVFLGSAPDIPKQICIVKDNKLFLHQSELEKKAGTRCSCPIDISFKTTSGVKGFGFYYPPSGDIPGGQKNSPVLIHVHGGPTSAYTRSFNNDAAFFSSRGYGYAQVNYRGSNGYGYTFQNALQHKWGIVDVEDTIAFTRALVEQGYASADRLAIIGSSAGGFTALNVLIRVPGMFKAAICSYAVSDLLEDARSTHKFEKYYHRFLVGDPKKDRRRFIRRSPINSIGNIKDPIALFHGDEDPVVSVDQTLSIYQNLIQNGVPCEITVYKGEGHGFRKEETLKDYYRKVDRFLKKHLLK